MGQMWMMRYYRSAVLAMFQSQSEKYAIRIDEFEGKVQLTDRYYREAEERNERTWISVAFGFRACKNGEWAVAAYRPDLEKASTDEQQPWVGFRIEDDAFPDELDPRFKKWIDRYIMGSWDVEEGPIASLDRVVKQVNAITCCVLDAPLLKFENIRNLCFPLAENTHRYQDAHGEVYKLIIDGLSKDALKRLGEVLNVPVKADNDKTLVSLGKLLSSDAVRAAVLLPLERLSKQRRLVGHNERPPSHSFRAFEEFGKDIRAVVAAMEALRDDLAERMNVDTRRCEERASALESLPIFDENRPIQPNYAIAKAFEMEGKQVVRVRGGETMSQPGRPEMEALILEFSDGSMMTLEFASNISQVVEDVPVAPEAVHLRFHITSVPPMLPYRPGSAAPAAGDQVVELVDYSVDE
jgi:hypothetical protein